jgi:cell division protein FtsL
MFGIVSLHVALTQGQFRLERLEARADAQQTRYERLRLQVAELESPDRIVAVAQERLGMVPPPGVTYLSPSGAVTDPPASRTADPGTAAGWNEVKPHLDTGQ